MVNGELNLFNKATSLIFIDLLLNLVLTYLILFALAFILINDTSSKNQTKNSNNILISMAWDLDCDIDLWLLMPDGSKIYYNRRDNPPAHLDVDVKRWRRYKYPDTGEIYTIKNNEEIISIRGIMDGKYVVNAHAYDLHNVKDSINVDILIQDVGNSKIIYAGSKTLRREVVEQSFVTFTVNDLKNDNYDISEVYTNRPEYFVGEDL